MSLNSRIGAMFTPTTSSGASGIVIDTSELDELAALLRRAADAAPDKADEALGKVVLTVHGAAVRNAAGFNTASTGELAAAVDYDRSGNSRRVFADVRQAYFLEYGSPKTGAPRPWLSGPAERGSLALLRAMAEVGELW